MGLVQNTDFYIIHFYDKPDAPVKSMWDIARGYWIYERLMMGLQGERKWLFVFPYGGSGGYGIGTKYGFLYHSFL